MNLTSKKKFALENNGVSFNQHASQSSTSPYKQNEKIIYLPKDFLKNNNILSTPITNTETNITIYNNASKQTAANPNSFRCQPNLLLYNKNFYKHPLILKSKHPHSTNNNTNTTNNTNNNTITNTSVHSQKMPPNVNINISTIDNKDTSVNSSITNSVSKPKGKIVSKVISFSKDKLEQIQQSKQMLCCYNSEGNAGVARCANGNSNNNMIYTRKRSKDRNKLKLIDERRKMCKSVKEINSNTFAESSECAGYNSLITSVEGLVRGKNSLTQDKDRDTNNEDSDYSSFGNGHLTDKDATGVGRCCRGNNVKQRIQLTKEVMNDKDSDNIKEQTLVHSILNTPSHKNTITVDNDDAVMTVAHSEVTKTNKDAIDNDKLLTLLKQKVERMKETHKRQSDKFNNINNSSNNEKYYLSNFNIDENQFKTTSTSSSKCSVSANKSNSVLKDGYCHYAVHTPLSTESGYKQVYSTPNTKHVHSAKYYEEVSPKQIVCGNIISSPSATKRQTHSSLKSSLRINNNPNLPTHTEKNKDSSYEYNYYVYSQVLNKHNNTNAKTKHNLKMTSANIEKTIKGINTDTANNNGDYDEAHLIAKNNIKDKIYTLEFMNSAADNNNNTIAHGDQQNTSTPQSAATVNKDKKYRLIYDYERIAKEARHSLYNTITSNTDSNSDSGLYDSSVHKKTHSVRDLKERKHMSNEDDEYANHKKTNSVRIYQNDNTVLNANPYYTIITQVSNSDKGAKAKNDKPCSNNANIELLSFVSKFPSKTNNVLIETIAKSSVSKSISSSNTSTSSSVYKYSKY